MEQQTTDELAIEMAAQLKKSIPLKMIRETAADKGFAPVEINTALDKAHTLVQQQADKDPVLRLALGAGLLVISAMAFYTDWAGRSLGFGSAIGLITLLIGGRLVWSLIKQWTKK